MSSASPLRAQRVRSSVLFSHVLWLGSLGENTHMPAILRGSPSVDRVPPGVRTIVLNKNYIGGKCWSVLELAYQTSTHYLGLCGLQLIE
jgi:hypothetical protein